MTTESSAANNTGSCQRTLRIPKGFQALLEGFAREVLRAQPPDIYEFGAEYFDRMVRTRAGAAAGDNPSRARQEPEAGQERNATEIGSPCNKSNIPELNGTSKHSQAATNMDKSPASSAARDVAVVEGDEEEQIDIDLNDPEVQAAAVKIQKGWGNRRQAAAVGKAKPAEPVEQPQPQPQPQPRQEPAEEEVVDIDLNDPDVQAAALKIQKGWGSRKQAGKQAPP